MKAPEYETQYFAGLEAECLTRVVACTFCRVLGIPVMRIAVATVVSAQTECLVHCGSRECSKNVESPTIRPPDSPSRVASIRG
jgi:hypothetical protein